MKILVTGHTGFIGTSLVKKLQSNYTVLTTNKNNGRRINVLEKSQLLDIDEVDTVIHLASKTSILDSISNPYDTYYTNIVGTLNILDYAIKRKIKNIINISTYTYGNPKYIPIDENHPLCPHSPYNKSKLISEKLCKYYSEDYKLNIVTLRPFYIYGPSHNSSFISSAIRKVMNNEKVILSKKNTRRDFLFVDDFVNLVHKILLNFPEGYNVYNVGYGKSYNLEDILRVIESIINKKISIEYNSSFRPNDVVEMVADIGKVMKKFEWSPTIDINEGLKLTIDRYSQMIKDRDAEP
ncbi:NAD-dependent epimerase/dehydratase family protein [Candidatus Nitrosocosmicus arcticus]|uniref:NAD-dependent epimerase/dehydratase family n=1 Tax=Candidatus Nitrosocosmicus arcticus TaxID=2035267 RepID=A0A557SYL6_9ARCH|nr:NAD-dependent epimerase/dehydratase family protein [Candidatus Nitrosocosmicus arcticus]TVP41696.1 NAD-dependent epimerase/dehydratase family [Candidatus Nitrosocosmicus arcticus]